MYNRGGVVSMSTITVTRPGERDRHGDRQPGTYAGEIKGARIAWAGTTVDADRKTIVTTRPTVYVKRQEPDIRQGDVLTTSGGRQLTVQETQPWEHPRHENIIMGTAIICEEVR